ncbi:Conserved protein containing a Zn-ribbon-like motif [Paraburkholderia caribensis MBA4]|uniref:Conserved protein containing a Zn-ribbon-like motif n=1 Tax=Paraburkholderia caribensis MBA4 TaxID=1323664 RepID=A0A0P0RHS7_9BURK|nr:ABATE domain-containing protein [Paraburkholderia caribensis]ALL68286.1 Conserved protein containing a Zn-ribbon-like motif [Paraburkholderia caribensis MBA4]
MVLEFLNTIAQAKEGDTDPLGTDEDAIRWFATIGILQGDLLDHQEWVGVASEARVLREVIGTLLKQRLDRQDVEIEKLNHFLRVSSYRVELVEKDDETLHSARKFDSGSATQALSPIALAAAELLANADFRRVRMCDGDACIIWFYDRTKAQRRRWCNTTLCGNRPKVGRVRVGAGQ